MCVHLCVCSLSLFFISPSFPDTFVPSGDRSFFPSLFSSFFLVTAGDIATGSPSLGVVGVSLIIVCVVLLALVMASCMVYLKVRKMKPIQELDAEQLQAQLDAYSAQAAAPSLFSIGDMDDDDDDDDLASGSRAATGLSGSHRHSALSPVGTTTTTTTSTSALETAQRMHAMMHAARDWGSDDDDDERSGAVQGQSRVEMQRRGGGIDAEDEDLP